MNLKLLLILAAGVVLGADTVQGNPKGDQEKILGTWKCVSIEVRGMSAGDKLKDYKVVLTKDRMILKDGDKDDGEFFYKLDPSKNPKWFDLAPIGKDGKAGKMALGIYDLNGDDLKICHPDPAKDRTTTFSSKPDFILYVLKRDKTK